MTDANPHLARRRSSVTVVRSEYSDATRRTNSQAENRLVLAVQRYDKAKEATCNDINYQKKQIERSLNASRRQSCPSLRLREYQERLDEERAQWTRKYKEFLAETESFKEECSPGNRKCQDYPSEGATGTTDETPEGCVTFTIGDDTGDTTIPEVTIPEGDRSSRRTSKSDIWSSLSTPKHRTASLRSLRSRFNESLETGRASVPRPRRSSQGVLSIPTRTLEVPQVCHSRSAENLSTVGDAERGTSELIDLAARANTLPPSVAKGDINVSLPVPRSPRMYAARKVTKIDLNLDVRSMCSPRQSKP